MRRSMLFVPGNNPKMMTSCGFFGSDSIIFDLEDAVSPAEKDAARLLVKQAITNVELCGCEVIVRINALDGDLWQRDLEAIVPQKPSLIMLPKTNCKSDILTLDKALSDLEKKFSLEAGSVRILALIETALGVENAYEIASASDRVEAIFLGAEDLTADLHCKRTKESNEIAYARGRMVVAARAAGVEVYDTPFTDVNDDEGIVVDAAYAKSLGFTGKASISPRHISAINRCFSPTQAEVDYAHEVLEAIEEAKRLGKGAIALHGKMVDAPIVNRAKQTIEAAEQIAQKGGTLA